MSPRTHAPIFTDDSGARRVTVQWGGRVIALACVALWAALALTLGTQVSLPGLDRLPSLSDSVRRAIFPDTRLTAIPDVDRRRTEIGRVSAVEVPRSLPRPADDSTEARPTAEPRRSIKDADRTEAVVMESATPGKSATRPGQSKPDPTPANPKSRKPAQTSVPSTVKPNPHANPRAKAAVSKAVGSKGVGSKAKTRAQVQPDPNGKPAKTKAADPAPRTSPSLRPGNDQPGQAPRGKPSTDQD